MMSSIAKIKADRKDDDEEDDNVYESLEKKIGIDNVFACFTIQNAYGEMQKVDLFVKKAKIFIGDK